MSGFASSITLSGKVFASPEIIEHQEAAGKVGKVLGVIAAVVIPFAAPAIFGAIASSGFIGSAIAGAAASGGFIGGLTNVIGSAVVGGIMNVAAGGSFGTGALAGGLGGVGRAFTAGGAGAVSGTTAPTLAPAGASGGGLSGITTAASTTSSGMAGALVNPVSGASPSIIQSITRMVGNNPQLVTRLGAAIVNAAVNGQSIEGMDQLVAQQRAELDALRSQDAAAYSQRINAAQQIVDAANRSDPQWLARVRMGDVAGVMNREHDEALRNIATRQGGSLDAGQRKAYDRSGRLAIGRAKALAWGQGQDAGVTRQAGMYAQGAGLMGPPNYAGWEAATRLGMDQQETRNRLNNSTAAGFVSAFTGYDHAPASSPEANGGTQQNQQNKDDAFGAGLRWPNG